MTIENISITASDVSAGSLRQFYQAGHQVGFEAKNTPGRLKMSETIGYKA